jgi:hypothetical protein
MNQLGGRKQKTGIDGRLLSRRPRLLKGCSARGEHCLLCASYWSLAWLTLYTEDGGDIFLRNVGRLSPALYPSIFIVAAVRTSNPKHIDFSFCVIGPDYDVFVTAARPNCVDHSLHRMCVLRTFRH